MEKIKTTAKAIKEHYKKCYSDVVIFTGYRYPSSGIKHIPHEIAEKYDKYAKKIIDANHGNKYEFVSDVLKNLINDMITELN